MRGKNPHNVVMIADDDMFVRKIVSGAIGPLARIVEVGDGAEVLRAYKANMPDMLFLDIHMPNMSGLDVLEEIKKIDPEAHVVMLSADSSSGNVSKASGLGVKGFLAKPFQRARIIAHMNNCPTIGFVD